jgi:hypothetical protein
MRGEGRPVSRYDHCDPDRRVLKLVRVGHHLWSLRRKLPPTGHERMAIDAALETVWQAKRELKAEIAVQKKESFAKWRRGT